MLSDRPRLINVSRGKSAHAAIVLVCESVHRQFLIDGVELDCIDQEAFIRDLNTGDRVQLGTLLYDPYELKTKDGTGTYVRVVTLACGNKIYIGLDQRNKRVERTATGWMWAGAIGAILFFIPLLLTREIIFFNQQNAVVIIICLVMMGCAVLFLKYMS